MASETNNAHFLELDCNCVFMLLCWPLLQLEALLTYLLVFRERWVKKRESRLNICLIHRGMSALYKNGKSPLTKRCKYMHCYCVENKAYAILCLLINIWVYVCHILWHHVHTVFLCHLCFLCVAVLDAVGCGQQSLIIWTDSLDHTSGTSSC